MRRRPGTENHNDNMERIYLDYAAAAPLEPEVKKVIDEVEANAWANASSLHKEGRDARGVIDQARMDIAKALDAETHQIIFTSGTTESNDLALAGVLQYARMQGGKPHLVVNRMEHASIIEPVEQWEKMGLEVTWLPVDARGLVDPGELKKSVKENTVLVSIIYANNETGAVNDIAKLSEIVGEVNPNTLFHTDAAQSLGWIDFKVKDLGVDLISAGSYKLGGPKGVGLLYLSPRVKLIPIFPGIQEWGKRAGTESTSAIAGFSKALELSKKWDRKEMRELRDHLVEQILQKVPDSICSTPLEFSVPHIAHFSFGGIDPQALIIALDREGVAASPGSACSSGAVEISNVVKALKIDTEKYPAALRLSLGKKTTREEIEKAIEIVGRVVEELRTKRR